jgi:hypothetical protein
LRGLAVRPAGARSVQTLLHVTPSDFAARVLFQPPSLNGAPRNSGFFRRA